MKLGLVCPYDIFRGGGVQEHVLAQAAVLRDRGFTVVIITPRPRGFKGDAPEGTIFVGNSAMVKTPIQTNVEVGIHVDPGGIDEMLAEEQFDILHIHEPEVPVLGTQIISRATCPVVATFHAIYPETPMARTLETLRVPYSRSIFSKLHTVTAVSDAAAQFIRQHTKEPVHIIPNGIDLGKYKHRTSKTVAAPNILYVGRLEKRKGVMYLLKAFSELHQINPDVRLIIAGEGDLRNQLQDYVHSEGLGPYVDFLGYVEESQKLALLSQATVFCSPALYGESFGIVLLEAMASGVVTVAGDNIGYSSVLQGTGRLSLVNPKETTEFARRLDLLLTDQGLRAVWQKWAKDYVKQYDYPLVVDKYIELYEKA